MEHSADTGWLIAHNDQSGNQVSAGAPIPSCQSVRRLDHQETGGDLEGARRPRTIWLKGIDDDVQSAKIGIHSAWRKANDTIDLDTIHPPRQRSGDISPTYSGATGRAPVGSGAKPAETVENW